MKFSNFPNKEYFSLCGELSEERQRVLIDEEEDFKKIANALEHAKGSIEEILGIAGDYMTDYNDELSNTHSEITAPKNKLWGGGSWL